MKLRRTAMAGVCAAALLLPPGVSRAEPGPAAGRPAVQRLSEGADGYASEISITPNGRYAVFSSGASNLVAGDTNGETDVFVRDLRTGRTERISVAADGTQGDYSSLDAAISDNGRYVVFDTWAANLPGGPGIHLKDRRTGELTFVGGDLGGRFIGTYNPAVSADGRYVAFSARVPTPRPAAPRTGVKDLRTGELRIIEAPGAENARFSANGRWVAYTSRPSGPPPNVPSDVLLWDSSTGQSRNLAVAQDGAPENGKSYAADLTPNGRYAVFHSSSTNLVPGEDPNGKGLNVFVRDDRTGALERIDGVEPGHQTTVGSLSADGRRVVFRSGGATEGAWYVRDLRTGRTEQAISKVTGEPAAAEVEPGSLDARGRTLVFASGDGELLPDPPAVPVSHVYSGRLSR
ncbi:TolB family protein [Streptomyces jumonjinensis]|uniref:TolB family protein n=1 Tax=Streptomyces jumonjinensis TaxID=1945 RepID=UPI00378D2425